MNVTPCHEAKVDILDEKPALWCMVTFFVDCLFLHWSAWPKQAIGFNSFKYFSETPELLD